MTRINIAYEEMTIQELRAAIKWRKRQIGSIYRTASYMTPEQLKPYEKLVNEIKEIEAHIAKRKAKRRSASAL